MNKIRKYIKENKKKAIVAAIALILILMGGATLTFYMMQPKEVAKENKVIELPKVEYEEKTIILDAEGVTEESTPFLAEARSNDNEVVYAKGYDKLTFNLVKGKEYKFTLATAVNKDGSIYDTNIEVKDNNVKLNKIANPTKEQITNALNKIAELAEKVEDTTIVETAGNNIKNNVSLPEEVKHEIETKVEEKKQEVATVVNKKQEERKHDNNNQVVAPVVAVQAKPKENVTPAPKAVETKQNTPAPAAPVAKPVETKPATPTPAPRPVAPAPAPKAEPKYRTVTVTNKNPNKINSTDVIEKIDESKMHITLFNAADGSTIAERIADINDTVAIRKYTTELRNINAKWEKDPAHKNSVGTGIGFDKVYKYTYKHTYQELIK